MSRVRSKCLNCGQRRACIKIEARAPLPESVLVPVVSELASWHERVDYEARGPMVELCRSCLGQLLVAGTLGKHLLEGLR